MTVTSLSNKSVARHYIVIISFLIAASGLLLYLVGLIPQAALKENYISSAKQIESEGVFPDLFNHNAYNSRLDNFTESIIVMSAYYMDTASSPESVVLNPYVSRGRQEMGVIAQDDSIQPDETYLHYWEGFRLFVRPLLVFFDYGEIRTLITWLFYLLLFAVTINISKYCGVLTGVSFFMSILLLNTTLITNSIQFSSCFFLCFIQLLLVPKVYKLGFKFFPLFFIVSGMLIQYFDFYTAPLLTYGLPLCYILLLKQSDQRIVGKNKYNLKVIVICALSWFIGYVGMWALKLLLITIYTPWNGVNLGFAAFSWRVGIEKDPNAMESYSILHANLKAMAALIGTESLGVLLASGFGISSAFLVFKLAKKNLLVAWFKKSGVFLAIACFPIIWFSVAAQPTFMHYWFQYRPLGISVFCVLISLSHAIQLLWPKTAKRIVLSSDTY